MALGNERFTVPELLFNPGDIGMKQAGLPEAVMQTMSGLPPGLWPSMLSNILVIGGNAKFDGFLARLYVMLKLFVNILINYAQIFRNTATCTCRMSRKSCCSPGVCSSVLSHALPVPLADLSSPIKSTWLGGARLAETKGALKELLITRQEYHEYGSAWLLKRFAVGNAS